MFRYYVAEINFLYLLMLTAWSRNSLRHYSDIKDEQGEDDAFAAFVKDFPPDLRAAFRDNNTWKLILKNEKSFDVNKPESTKSALAYFDRTLQFLEQVGSLLRRSAIRANAGKGANFKKNLLELQKNTSVETYTPFDLECDNSCFGFPKGTRMFYVEFLPLFQLTLVRIAGRLRIVDFNFAVP